MARCRATATTSAADATAVVALPAAIVLYANIFYRA